MRIWIKAARPRTLLLSLSGVMMGGLLAASGQVVYPLSAVLAALTAMLLQVLSNLANDYGDFKKGLDDANRVGPQRALQSGELTETQLRNGIAFTALLCLLSGAALLLVSWSHVSWKELAVFAVLGLLAIAAALLYTLGKHPYGYHGLGDFFCFLFFGLVAVVGTNYLSSPGFDWLVALPAMAMGCLTTAVLNINNMRDHDNDKAKGKNTMVVRMGLKRAFFYHLMLVVLPFLLLTLFLVLKKTPWYTYAFWLLFPLFIKDLVTLHRSLSVGVPDRLLPRQVLFTFLVTLVFGLTLCYAT